MGEDLQEHLNNMSNDKVQLAKNIDAFSQQISIDQMTHEQLLIDNDLWRSKFMASRLVDFVVSFAQLYFVVFYLKIIQTEFACFLL